MEQFVIFAVIFGIGMWIAWRQISSGSGWICSHFSAATLQNLNSKEGLVKKILLAAVLAYIILGVSLIKFVLNLALRLTDGHL